MKKLLFSILLIVAILSLSVATGFAAPDYLSGGDTGAYGMLTITNPDKVYSTTYNNSYSISGFAENGSSIYLYNSDGNGGYNRNYNYYTVVGASGLFVIPVTLSNGKNSFAIRAENNGSYQTAYFEINMLSSSMYNLVKNFKLFK